VTTFRAVKNGAIAWICEVKTMAKQFDEWPELMMAKDIVECTDMPRDDAYNLFRQPDFPQVNTGKRRSRMVGKFALREWLNRGKAS